MFERFRIEELYTTQPKDLGDGRIAAICFTGGGDKTPGKLDDLGVAKTLGTKLENNLVTSTTSTVTGGGFKDFLKFYPETRNDPIWRAYF